MAEIEQGDSGLECPWCGYNLTSLTSSNCPECGKRFVVAKPGVLSNLKDGGFIVSRSMQCPECGFNNSTFMPSKCVNCDFRFSLFQRFFGIRAK